MSTRAERVEVILDALIANDGEPDRVLLASAVADALEPMLLDDDRAARRRGTEVAGGIIAVVLLVVFVAVIVTLTARFVHLLWP